MIEGDIGGDRAETTELEQRGSRLGQAQAAHRAGGKFDGFQFGDGDVSVDDTLLLLEPEAAKQYAVARKKFIVADPPEGGSLGNAGAGGGSVTVVQETDKPGPPGPPMAKAKSFLGFVDRPAATAKMRLVQFVEEIVNLLATDPNAIVRVTLEISADFPNGVPDNVRRAVGESANSLGLKVKTWEQAAHP